MFTPEEKLKVREATDLVQLVSETVALRQRGNDMWGCCPFHHEKSPSFHVMPDRGFWKCFSCGKSGDCFTYVMERDHVEFPDAVRLLADRAGITLSDDGREYRKDPNASQKARLYEVVEEAAHFFHATLTRSKAPGAAQARAYLAKRGFGSAVAAKWELGYALGSQSLVKHLTTKGFSAREMCDANLAVRRDDGSLGDRFFNRVMFTIRDERGRAVGFGGRVLDDSKPKYLNTSETQVFHKKSNLFALDVAKASITAHMEAVVMEGYTDVIASQEAGITNAVAPLGTAFTAQQVKILTRYLTAAGERLSRGRIVCLFDGDEAGLKAAERAMQFVQSTTAGMYCVVLPGGMDPADYIEKEGAESLKERIAEQVPLVRFVVDRHLDRYDCNTPEQRALALADVVQALGPVKGTTLADEYVDYVAGRLLADPTTVKGALAQVRWQPPREDDDEVLGCVVQTRQGTLSMGGGSNEEAAKEQPVRPQVQLLPEDAMILQIERELLSVMAADPQSARLYTERIASLTWRHPSHEAIAWAILSAPDGCSPAAVVCAAESVCPDAASILAAGARSLEDAHVGFAVEVLLDELEIRDIKRRIDRGRALLRTQDVSNTEELMSTMQELTQLQQTLVGLEERRRMRR